MVKISAAAHFILRHSVHNHFTDKSQHHLNAKLHTNNLSLAKTQQASNTDLLVDGICQRLFMWQSRHMVFTHSQLPHMSINRNSFHLIKWHQTHTVCYLKSMYHHTHTHIKFQLLMSITSCTINKLYWWHNLDLLRFFHLNYHQYGSAVKWNPNQEKADTCSLPCLQLP